MVNLLLEVADSILEVAYIVRERVRERVIKGGHIWAPDMDWTYVPKAESNSRLTFSGQ